MDRFSSIWKLDWNFDRILIDVPIGLPHDEETLKKREMLDSAARSVTGRPGSVFPAPSRGACEAAKADDDYFPDRRLQNTPLLMDFSGRAEYRARAVFRC
jgi:predicted RNase H-like nuclease